MADIPVGIEYHLDLACRRDLSSWMYVRLPNDCDNDMFETAIAAEVKLQYLTMSDDSRTELMRTLDAKFETGIDRIINAAD